MCSLMLYPLHIKSILSRNPSKCWFSEACPRGAILASKIDQLRFSNPHFRILRVKYSLMQKVSSLCDNLFNITKIRALCQGKQQIIRKKVLKEVFKNLDSRFWIRNARHLSHLDRFWSAVCHSYLVYLAYFALLSSLPSANFQSNCYRCLWSTHAYEIILPCFTVLVTR